MVADRLWTVFSSRMSSSQIVGLIQEQNDCDRMERELEGEYDQTFVKQKSSLKVHTSRIACELYLIPKKVSEMAVWCWLFIVSKLLKDILVVADSKRGWTE